MGLANRFETFCSNLQVKNGPSVSSRYEPSPDDSIPISGTRHPIRRAVFTSVLTDAIRLSTVSAISTCWCSTFANVQQARSSLSTNSTQRSCASRQQRQRVGDSSPTLTSRCRPSAGLQDHRLITQLAQASEVTGVGFIEPTTTKRLPAATSLALLPEDMR